MNYQQFIAELGRAGLNVRAFAELIGMNKNSVSNYAAQEKVPRNLAIIAVLMSEMNTHGLEFREVVVRAISERAPRKGTRPGRFGGDKQQQLDLR